MVDAQFKVDLEESRNQCIWEVNKFTSAVLTLNISLICAALKLTHTHTQTHPETHKQEAVKNISIIIQYRPVSSENNNN